MTEGEIRSLAVEIVDFVHGYTVEFSNAPENHELDYDWVEERLAAALSAPQVILTGLLESLPSGHHERPGIIRSIECLRTTS